MLGMQSLGARARKKIPSWPCLLPTQAVRSLKHLTCLGSVFLDAEWLIHQPFAHSFLWSRVYLLMLGPVEPTASVQLARAHH